MTAALSETSSSGGAGLEGLWRGNRRAIIAYTLLNIWLIPAVVIPLMTHYRWLRLSSRATGFASLILMIVCLAVGPLARVLRRPDLNTYRRAIGLAALFYAVVHTVMYLYTGKVWEMTYLRFMRRQYILIGFFALYFMIPLAITSTNAAIRNMTRPRWRRLHMGIYPAIALTLLHYQMPHYSYGVVYYYAAATLAVMGWRAWLWSEDRRRLRERDGPIYAGVSGAPAE